MRAPGAGVAELVDAADSKSASRKGVKVRFLSPVPYFQRCIAELNSKSSQRTRLVRRTAALCLTQFLHTE